MKRWWLVAGALLLVVGVGVSPVAAAKGGGRPSVQSVEGSFSGTSTFNQNCWPNEDPNGDPPQFCSFNVSAEVGVRASSLGRGTMQWNLNMGGGSWTFVTSDGKSTLGGSGRIVMFNVGGVQYARNEFQVYGAGTGKFAGVTGGSLQTGTVSVAGNTPPPMGVPMPLTGTISGVLTFG